jgi:hypothetical protein
MTTNAELSKTLLLAKWEQAKKETIEAKKIIEAEMTLRKQVMETFFPKPDEGVNTLEMGNGWKLKGTHKLDYKVDEAMLEHVNVKLRELGENPDLLIERKPTLKLSQYRDLVKRNKDASLIFTQALTIKPASPTVELVAPKE